MSPRLPKPWSCIDYSLEVSINSTYSVYEELDLTTLEGDVFSFYRLLVYAVYEMY